MRLRPLLTIAELATAAAIVGLLAVPVERTRQDSPDGSFTAVVRTLPIQSLVPMMPGQASDKPGRVTVYRGTQSCGSAPLEMVSIFYDFRWELAARPRRAEIRLVANWNLDDCSVEVSGR